MNRESSIEHKLRKAIVPVPPRREFMTTLKEKILNGSKMPVGMEQSTKMSEVMILTAIGLGAVATVAAVATIGVKLVSLIGSGALIVGATKSGTRKEAKTSMV